MKKIDTVVHGTNKYDGLYSKGALYEGKVTYHDLGDNNVLYYENGHFMLGDKLSGQFPMRSNSEVPEYQNFSCPNLFSEQVAPGADFDPEKLPWLAGTLTGWNANK